VIDFAHGCHAAVTGSGGGGVFSLVSLCGTVGSAVVEMIVLSWLPQDAKTGRSESIAS